jgi:RNA polymerase subunit RPABC4/transcription elongation factor Spt4
MRKGASRAQLEADKLLRINRVQSQINALKQQTQQRTVQLGEKALELYRVGQLTEHDLVTSCESIVALEKEIAVKETQIEAIKRESLPEEEAVVSSAYGHLCPQCKISLPEEAVFCPNCGSKTVDISPPATAITAAKCTNCGAALLTEAAFCPQCGAKVEREHEATESGGTVCSECQSFFPEGAIFCPNCGNKVGEEPTPVSKTTNTSEAETAL